jgi:hypothetical protein
VFSLCLAVQCSGDRNCWVLVRELGGNLLRQKHRAHSTQHTASSTQHTTHSTQHTVHSKQHTASSTQHTAHSTQHTVHIKQHTAHHTQHTAHIRSYEWASNWVKVFERRSVTLAGHSEVSLAATTSCQLQLCTVLSSSDSKRSANEHAHSFFLNLQENVIA